LILPRSFDLLVAMGFQFLHIEGYARVAGKGKAGGHTIATILAEAMRAPDACSHIVCPQPPTLLFGCPLVEVAAMAEAWAEAARDSIGRKLRKDGLCLLGGVVSAPDEMTAEQWEGMKRDALAYLDRDGRLVSAVEHGDESHRHIHFFKLPGVGQRFESIHAGRAAAVAAKEAGGAKGAQNAAYIKAMRAFQDDFFAEVGCRYGLTRLGPARRRLTRAEWHAEQQNAVAKAVAMTKADEMTAEAVEFSTLAAAMRAEADAAKESALAAAEIAKAEADKAAAALALAEQKRKANQLTVAKWSRERAAMVVMSKKIEAEKQSLGVLKKVGARIGAFVGALVGKTANAVAAVMDGRKATDGAKAKALQVAMETAKAEADRRLSAEQATKLAERERDAAKEEARGRQREAEAERRKLEEVIAVVRSAQSLKQIGPAKRPTL
jgi:hypothetical protein